MSSNDLAQFRNDIDDAIELVRRILQQATTGEERLVLTEVTEALVAVATEIDEQELASRNAAIQALIGELGNAAKDLDDIHQKAVQLKNALGIAQKLIDAFGTIKTALQSAGGAKAKAGSK